MWVFETSIHNMMLGVFTFPLMVYNDFIVRVTVKQHLIVENVDLQMVATSHGALKQHSKALLKPYFL